ncbi:MAG TPA: carboxypeptidase regulatory-like domain-containing protein [Vicinamibacterales bacterium]|nr:carboxypeptidase regulatory-like domain-containing protein [Vicinamibacterales bacterium]
MTGHVRSFALAGLVAIIGLAGPVALAQQQIPQQPPTGSGAITGTVIDGTSGQPVSGALVFLSTTEPGRTAPIAQTRQVTDDRGRFAFIEIPGDGIFTIAVSKFGFLDGGYGRDHSPSDPLRPVALKKDDWVGGLRVSIWRPGSISGVVRDESGDPVVGVFVRVLSRFRIQGRDDMVAGPITVTNDRGEYRIPGLAPGRYAVQVPSVQASVPWSTKISFNPGNLAEGVVDIDDSNRLVLNRYPLPPPPQNGRPMSYPIVFHPSASTLAVASLIDLKYGDERTGIDLTLTPAPAVRVSGTVEGPADAMKSLTLRLLPAGLENAGLGSEAATALVSGDGRFTFMNVPAGTYTLDAPVKVTELSTTGSGISQMRGPRFPMPPPAQGSGMSSNSIDLIPGLTIADTTYRSGAAEYSGRMTVSVGASDVNNIVLRLRAHATFSGKIVIESDPSKPNEKPPSRFPMRLDPAAGEIALGMPQSSFQEQGGTESFTIPAVKPGVYFLRLSAFAQWQVKSINWHGRDYTNVPFDSTTDADFSGITVTVTNALPELTGTVRGTTSGDNTAETAMVVAFPADRAGWRNTGLNPSRMKYATVSNTGTYRFATLPAGDYLIAAIDRSLLPVWRETDFLTRLERSASRITLTWATRSSQDLTVVNIR